MGTKFRTLLAPIGVSTGDGRRFQAGGISLADLPMPFEWARSREGGHDGAVSIGTIQEAAVMTVADAVKGDWISADAVKGLDAASTAVFGRGELYDDVDREQMPRLAEDVAEATHLITNGTLGPSVDLDSFQAIPVMAGSDEELTWDDIEQYMDEHDGAEPEIELLITQGRVRAATLVSIPAFSETSRPLELIEQDADALALAASENPDLIGQWARERDESIAAMSALTAAAAGADRPLVAQFVRPSLDGPTPITWDWDAGRVFGHIATWRTCHVGYGDVCVTPPHADQAAGYAWFNRFSVETADGGTIAAGRLTLGGRHAGLALSASSAMAAYDDKTVAADVVAYEDEHGIVVAGVIRPGLSGADRAVLDRRKVSGDWREIGGNLALVEVLALSPGPRAHSEPGFPVAETYSRGGRQLALTASFGPEDVSTSFRTGGIDIEGAVRRAFAAEREEQERQAAARAALAAARDARAALAVMFKAEDDQARQELAAVLGEG